MHKTGAVARDGRLHVGHRILEVSERRSALLHVAVHNTPLTACSLSSDYHATKLLAVLA